MEALSKELEAKLQLLDLTNSKTKRILAGGNAVTLERHLDALKGVS